MKKINSGQTEQIHIKVTQKQKQFIKKMAELSGQSISDFIKNEIFSNSNIKNMEGDVNQKLSVIINFLMLSVTKREPMTEAEAYEFFCSALEEAREEGVK